MDKIFFSGFLPQLILDGNKDSTWRINEDIPRKSDTKNTKVGDIISLCYDSDDSEFSRAEVTEVTEKILDELNDGDFEGHDKFDSKEDLYKTFSGYYKIPINGKTRIKVIKFKLLV